MLHCSICDAPSCSLRVTGQTDETFSSISSANYCILGVICVTHCALHADRDIAGASDRPAAALDLGRGRAVIAVCRVEWFL